MDPRLQADIIHRLEADYGFKKRTQYLREGRCPACEKKEMWTWYESPWVLKCARDSKCGASYHIKEIYPDLFDRWSDRFVVTETNPNAAADAYLRDDRRFDLARINGWYSQETYFDKAKNIGTATVRFSLPGGHWERLIDQPHRFGKKAHFKKGTSYGHTWWCPPGVDLTKAKEVWIVEGIFDAIALLHHDITAVAALSCNNDCAASLKALAELCDKREETDADTDDDPATTRPTIVWALDGDRAGASYTKKWVKSTREAGWTTEAAQIPENGRKRLDWSDLHQLGQLDDKAVDEARYQGALLIAANAYDKSRLIYARTGLYKFNFEFDHRLYWFVLDIDKQAKVESDLNDDEAKLPHDEREGLILRRASTVTMICNCLPQPLYYLKNAVTDDAWYYFRVSFPHGAKPVKNNFTAAHLASAAEFKKRLLHIAAGAMWKGTSGQLDTIMERWTYGIKQVETIDYIGYTAEHGCYVFNEVAVKDGRFEQINEEDYFEFGKLRIKSLLKTPALTINTAADDYDANWFHLFHQCFGARGVLALAAFFGSLFAEQVRERFESFPFVELVGEPGSGKTTLLEFLWKLLGRNGYEGFDPMKGTTVGFLRAMAQVSNLPVVLIESDREPDADGGRGRPQSTFHWDSLKSLYNGGSLRTSGVKSAGNDTYDPQFRAALFISQNNPVKASDAIMERIIHVWFDKAAHTESGRAAALELGRLPIDALSGFILRALATEAKVLKAMAERMGHYEDALKDYGVGNQRLQKNHAQLAVFVDALALVTPISRDQRDEALHLIEQIARQREEDLRKDHPVVEAFWEIFDYIDGDATDEHYRPVLNHARNKDEIAVNLNHFYQVATERRQQIPQLADLKKFLKTSRMRRFSRMAPVNSKVNDLWNHDNPHTSTPRPATVKCWIFDRGAGR